MNDKGQPDERPLGREDESLLRLIREGVPRAASDLPGEDVLVAYVLGTTTPEESEAVRSAMQRDPELRRQMLDLLRGAEAGATVEEQTAFDQAPVPTLRRSPELAELAARIGHSSAGGSGPLKRSRRLGWLDWALGGWAVTATAAVCVMLIVMASPGPGPILPPSVPPSSEPPGGAFSKAPTVTPSITIGVVKRISLRGPTRGEPSASLPWVALAPSEHLFQVSVDPPDFPDGSDVLVSLVGPDGKTLLEEVHPIEDFFGSKALTLQSREPFEPGKYRLTIEGERDAVRETVSYAFEIREMRVQ